MSVFDEYLKIKDVIDEHGSIKTGKMIWNQNSIFEFCIAMFLCNFEQDIEKFYKAGIILKQNTPEDTTLNKVINIIEKYIKIVREESVLSEYELYCKTFPISKYVNSDLFDLFKKLSPTQKEIIKSIIEGLPQKDVAKRLNITPGAVNTQANRIIEKIDKFYPALYKQIIEQQTNKNEGYGLLYSYMKNIKNINSVIDTDY